jgi:hypothetical protein
LPKNHQQGAQQTQSPSSSPSKTNNHDGNAQAVTKITLMDRLMDRDGWYAKLNKPKITPSNLVFTVIWTLLYILIGCSYYIYK